MSSLLHKVRWYAELARELLLKPQYRPKEFWERRHRTSDGFRAVGRRSRDEKENEHWYGQLEQDLLEEIRQQQFDLTQMSVLEIGPGIGYWTNVVRRLGCREYLGIEIASVAVQDLLIKFPEYRFQVGDVSQVPIQGKWDLFLMMHVDEHIHGENFIKALTAIKHAMKPTSSLLSTYHPGEKKSGEPHVEHHTEGDFAEVFPAEWISRAAYKFGNDPMLSISESHTHRDHV